MKKVFSCLLAMLGLTTACGQQHYENVGVRDFAALLEEPHVTLLDVRTAEEFSEGHLVGAMNIDQKQADFLKRAKAELPKGTTIAVYCRSGRRSASAADMLASEGYKCVNLSGGILAWEKAGKKVTQTNYEVDVFKTKTGKTLKFHALMHGSIRIEYNQKEIEIDPVGKLGGRVVDFSQFPKADYVFVTHEHGDHYDPSVLKVLMGSHTQLIMNKRCVDLFGAGQMMKNGDKLQIADDLMVEAVPAYNITEGHLQFHPKSRDNGYILTIDGLRIYIAGDTEDIPEMASIKDIDIAFLPCNQPYTMTPEQLVKAAKTIKPKVLFPYHYGQKNVSSLPQQLDPEGIDVRIRHYE